jgi:hypothetical protein
LSFPLPAAHGRIAHAQDKKKRLTDCGHCAVERLAEIETCITGLPDNDLLDLADIFKAEPLTPIDDMAFLEMTQRNISL